MNLREQIIHGLRMRGWSRMEAEDRAFEVLARDSDGTATAAVCEDIPAPQGCQARAESIAQKDKP